MPKYPHRDTQLAHYMRHRVKELRGMKSQADIAEEAGFVNANMISILKNGAAKLPLDRVPDMARALECDERRLFMMAIQQHGHESTRGAIERIFGTIVTANEVTWITELRDASDHSDPALTMRARKGLRAIFNR